MRIGGAGRVSIWALGEVGGLYVLRAIREARVARGVIRGPGIGLEGVFEGDGRIKLCLRLLVVEGGFSDKVFGAIIVIILE